MPVTIPVCHPYFLEYGRIMKPIFLQTGKHEKEKEKNTAFGCMRKNKYKNIQKENQTHTNKEKKW